MIMNKRKTIQNRQQKSLNLKFFLKILKLDNNTTNNIDRR